MFFPELMPASLRDLKPAIFYLHALQAIYRQAFKKKEPIKWEFCLQNFHFIGQQRSDGSMDMAYCASAHIPNSRGE